jgi:hypothetical protein
MSLHILQRALPGSEWAQEDHVQRLNPVKLTIDSEPTAFLITDLEYKGENGRHMTRQAVLQRSYLIQQNYHSLAVPQNGTKKDRKHSFALLEGIAPSAQSLHGSALSESLTFRRFVSFAILSTLAIVLFSHFPHEIYAALILSQWHFNHVKGDTIKRLPACDYSLRSISLCSVGASLWRISPNL